MILHNFLNVVIILISLVSYFWKLVCSEIMYLLHQGKSKQLFLWSTWKVLKTILNVRHIAFFLISLSHWLLLEWPGDWGALSSLRPNLLKQALPVKCWHVTWRDVWRRRRVTGISDKSRNHVTACAVWPPTTADCHQGCEFRRKLAKVFCFSELCLNICKAFNLEASETRLFSNQ